MRVLITGATGAVGPAVVREFLEAGEQVRILSRHAVPVAPSGVTVVRGDLLQAATLTPAVDEIDVIVHLAGLAHQTDPHSVARSAFDAVNVDGTGNLMKAAAAAGVKRVVFFSTIAVYGADIELKTEDSATRPDSLYGRSKLAAERVVFDTTADGKPESVVLRLAAVYGPLVKGNYSRLVEALAGRRFVRVGRGANRRTLVHEKDVARAAVLAAQHPSAAGRIYNVSDGAVHTVDEIVRAICVALGRRPPRLRIPLSAARAALRVVEVVAMAAGTRPTISPSTLAKYTEDVAVAATRIQRELGFRPLIALERGWQDTVEGLRERGALP
jgi:UDP-glucose 4-epimerase